MTLARRVLPLLVFILLIQTRLVSLSAGPVADLFVSISDSADPVTAGEMLTYTIHVDNVGSPTTNVVVTETLPMEVTFLSTSGCAEDPVGFPNCTLGSLGAESSVEYTITVLVASSATGTLENSASATSALPDLDPNDNMATEFTDVVTSADLSLSKLGSVDPVVAGENLAYTLTVTNNGPSDAVGVVVSDTLGPGLSLVSTSGCAEDPSGAPTCNLGTLAAGAMVQYTLNVLVDPSANFGVSNSATVSSSTTEAAPGDESAQLDTGVVRSSLFALTKTDSVDPVMAGSNLTYTITLSNAGPSDADFVELADFLPVGVTFLSSSGCLEEDENPPGVHLCLIDNVAAGDSTQYTITVAVELSAPSQLTNNVEVAPPELDAPPLATASETTAVITAADLSLTKTDLQDPIAPGDNVTYLLTVSNSGPSEALNVVVTDTLPTGLTFVSSSGCAEDPNGAPTCSLGNIDANSSKQYSLTFASDPGASGVFSNSAQVASDSIEVGPGDEADSEITSVVPVADLGVEIIDQPDPAAAGGQLTYNVSVGNSGPSPSSAATFHATLDGGVQFVSISRSCTVLNRNISCALGPVAVEESVDFQIVVEVLPDTVGQIGLDLGVFGAESDSEEGNNHRFETTQVDSSTDLSLVLSVLTESPALGEPLALGAVVRNLGLPTATGVRLVWNLPAGVSINSTSVSPQGGCVQASGFVTCALGNVRSGETFDVALSVTPNQTGPLLSDATLSANNPDPVSSNNEQRLFIQIGASADLAVTKETDSELAVAGLPLIYRIAVTNDGPSPAASISVEDILPSEVTALVDGLPEGCRSVETAGAGGAPGGQAVLCSIESLEADSQVTLLIPVQVLAGARGTFSNQVSVQSATPDPDEANNSSSVTNRAVSAGDLNGDGLVNALDLSVLVQELNDGDGNQVADVAGGDYPGDSTFDVNGDGLVDESDLEELVTLVLGK